MLSLQVVSNYSRPLVAQLVKNPPVMQDTWVRSLGWEDPLEKGESTHSSILAWRIPWTIVHGVTKSQTRLSDLLHIVTPWNAARQASLSLAISQICVVHVYNKVTKSFLNWWLMFNFYLFILIRLTRTLSVLIGKRSWRFWSKALLSWTLAFHLGLSCLSRERPSALSFCYTGHKTPLLWVRLAIYHLTLLLWAELLKPPTTV